MALSDCPAVFFDGVSAGRREVLVDADASIGALRIKTPEGKSDSAWRFENVRLVKDAGSRALPVLFRRVDGVEERLVLQTEAALEALRPLCPNLTKSDVSSHTYGKMAKWAVAAVASLALMILVIIPSMANTLANFIPPEREAAIGRGVISQIEWVLDEAGSED